MEKELAPKFKIFIISSSRVITILAIKLPLSRFILLYWFFTLIVCVFSFLLRPTNIAHYKL